MPAAPIVQLHNVAVRYGHVPVLTGVDLEVPAGEAVGIVGPNGSGKSTLLRVLATLLRPTEGSVTVFGDQMGEETAFNIRRRIALIGHQPALYPQLTLRENLAFVGRLSGHSEERVDEMLEIVGLAGAMERRAEQSSHGMQRRVEFARVILTRPELLLLDEAHAGLDREAGLLVDAVVDNVRSRGGAAVFVSHELDRMMPLVQATYELAGGTVVPGGAFMKRLTFWGQAYEIGRKDLRIEGRSGEVLNITIPFGAVALLLIPLSIGADRPLLATIGPGMFWVVTLLFGMLVTFRQSATETVANREMMVLLGVDPAAQFAGRVTTSFLLLLVFEGVLAPLTIILYNPDPVSGWGVLLLVLVLLAMGLALIGTLASGITAGLRSRNTLAPLLVAPLALPLLVGASQTYEALGQESSILDPILLLVVVVLGLAVVGVLTARFLEEAAR